MTRVRQFKCSRGTERGPVAHRVEVKRRRGDDGGDHLCYGTGVGGEVVVTWIDDRSRARKKAALKAPPPGGPSRAHPRDQGRNPGEPEGAAGACEVTEGRTLVIQAVSAIAGIIGLLLVRLDRKRQKSTHEVIKP